MITNESILRANEAAFTYKTLFTSLNWSSTLFHLGAFFMRM